MDLRTVAYVLVLYVLMTLLVRDAHAQPVALPSTGETAVVHAAKERAAGGCTAGGCTAGGDGAVGYTAAASAGPFLLPPRLRKADIAWTKRLWRDVPLDGRRDSSGFHPDVAFGSAFQERFAAGTEPLSKHPGPFYLRIREAWHFDRVHGVLRPYLEGMGIATGPAREDLRSWAGMEELRPWLAGYPVNAAGHQLLQTRQHPQKHSGALCSARDRTPLPEWAGYSWHDVFTLQRYSGHIVYERNAMDRHIADYAFGEAAQAEHDRITRALVAKEASYWMLPESRSGQQP